MLLIERSVRLATEHRGQPDSIPLVCRKAQHSCFDPSSDARIQPQPAIAWEREFHLRTL